MQIIDGLFIAEFGIASAATIMNNNHKMSAGGGFGEINYISPSESATNQTAQFQIESTDLRFSESVIVSCCVSGQNLKQIKTANGIDSFQSQTDEELSIIPIKRYDSGARFATNNNARSNELIFANNSENIS